MKRIRCHRRRLAVIFFGISLLLSSAVPATEEQPLVFGFLPIQSTPKLMARFSPLVEYLSTKLGRPVRLETAPDYAEFLRRSNEERRYDILFTAPHFYYLAQREAGYRVIVRVAAPSMRAIIVVPKDSDIHTLQDLRGHTLATVDPLALGTALVRETLRAAGIDPEHDLTLRPTPTHDASLLSAYKHITDAASLMIPPFNHARPEIRAQMRIIARTAGTPHMPISVAARLPAAQVKAIESALLDLNSGPAGRALLRHLGWPGFARAAPAEYDALRPVAEQVLSRLH